jgi:hypothetical protein
MDDIHPVSAELNVSEKKVDETLSLDYMQLRFDETYGKDSNDGSEFFDETCEFMVSKAQAMSLEEGTEILVQAIGYHEDDPNFPVETMKRIKGLVQGEKAAERLGIDDYVTESKIEASLIHYHSPYPQVRLLSTPFDTIVPVETFRSYLRGLFWMAGATAVNTFFSPRQPGISIGAPVLQLLLAPCGFFCARVLPNWGFTVFGIRHSLNPGPWTYKEQMFATIIFNIANSAGAVFNIFLVQRLPQYFGYSWVGFGYEIMLSISTQCFGLGFAGLLRHFVVYPTRTWFPSVFPILALNRALMVTEKKEYVNGWTMSRYKFFFLCFGAMFLYFWIPNFLFQALHSFNWVTWIAPGNFTLAMVTGFYAGFGIQSVVDV